nr:uromodulin-like 1 [Ciona intestinalis]|eukprot:XP_002122163.1 uromodulin-like 1 [Ciona intestinalis]
MTLKIGIAVFLVLYVAQGVAGKGLTRNKRAFVDAAQLSTLNITNGLQLTNYVNMNASLNISCSAKSVNMSISLAYLSGFNVASIKELVLLDKDHKPINDSSCRATSDGSSYKFSIHGAFGMCAKKVESHQGLILVNYTILVVSQPQGIVSRDSTNFIQMSCAYRRELNATLAREIIAQTAREHIQVAPKLGDLRLELKRLNSTGQVETSSDVIVGNTVYFGMDLPTTSARYNLFIQASRCWITPSANASTPTYNVISNGIAAPDSSMPNANIVTENNAVRLRASFVSFIWFGMPVDNQWLYLHCNVRVCDNSVNSNMCSTPIGRRRRSVDVEKKHTIGPFKLHKAASHSYCNKDEMKCEHDCAVANNGQHICTCPYGWILSRNEKSCYKHNPAAERIHLEMKYAMDSLDTNIHTVSLMLGGLIVLVTIAIVMSHREK